MKEVEHLEYWNFIKDREGLEQVVEGNYPYTNVWRFKGSRTVLAKSVPIGKFYGQGKKYYINLGTGGSERK